MSVITLLTAAAGTPGAFGIHFDAAKPGGAPVADALKIVLVLTVLAVLPAMLVAMTSFTRTIIVLSMIRHGLGMQDTPPNLVLISIAMFLTLFTMSPALDEINAKSLQPLLKNEISLQDAVTTGLSPLREFMIHQTREKDLQLILDIGHASIPDSVQEVQTVHLIPAFLLSELKTGFQIGFVIFLPFLLIDLVIASILMAMGMLMVPPTILSLPFKILLFVLIDGWSLTVRALLGELPLKLGAAHGALQPETDVAGLWKALRELGDPDAREQLIILYGDFARMIAAKVYGTRRDDTIAFKDYLQYAQIGLIEALDRFDARLGDSFETYSSHRIRGSILNGLSRQTELRAQRVYWREVIAERRRSVQEPQKASGDPAFEDFARLAVSLAIGLMLDDSDTPERADDSVEANPYAGTELSQMRERVRMSVDQLPARERDILRRHYYEHREFQDIAAELGVTKGRVSQLHARALQRVREALNVAPRIDRKV